METAVEYVLVETGMVVLVILLLVLGRGCAALLQHGRVKRTTREIAALIGLKRKKNTYPPSPLPPALLLRFCYQH